MRMIFRRVEIEDIIIATLVLGLAFEIAFFGFKNTLTNFIFLYGVSIIAVLTGFVGHEMLHKYAAFRYNYFAEFRRWNLGLIIALSTSFLGIVFAAPGATNIYGYLDRKTNGKIAASGPLYNLILGSIFISFYYLGFPFSGIFLFIGTINVWLAFFNLWPIPPLDGSKVITWNIPVYIILLATSGFLTLKFIFGL
ncbi:MAG: site-2 protease family protein [Thermoplasmata archaeon]